MTEDEPAPLPTILPAGGAPATYRGLRVRVATFAVSVFLSAWGIVFGQRVFISGRQQPGSRRTQRRLQRFRTGAEGRISDQAFNRGK